MQFFLKTIESDDIARYVPEFLARMMQSRKIGSISVVCTDKSRKVTENTRVLGGGIEIPLIYQTYGCEKKNQNIRAAIRKASLKLWTIYIVYKHKNFFFSQKGLISVTAYIQKTL